MSFMQGRPGQSFRMGAPMTYAAAPMMQEPMMMEQPQMMTYAAPPQQMVYAAAPQQQVAVRSSPQNLLQGGQIVSERPVSKQELVQAGRLFESEPEKPPVIIPAQMIQIQQQPMQEMYMEQPVTYAAPPMTYAAAPQMTYAAAPTMMMEQPMTYAAPPMTYAAAPAGSVMVEEVLMAQPATQMIIQEPMAGMPMF